MNEYEKLVNECEENNINVIEKNFKSNAKGLIKGNKIGISAKIDTIAEKRCVLAEELGHYHTTTGNILDQSNLENRKQEYKARKWSYNKLVGTENIIKAFQCGCKDKFEIAEFLNVTVEFLEESIECYKKVYGVFVNVGEYTIIFTPNLAVVKSI